MGAVWDLWRLGFGAGVAGLEGRREEAVAGYLESVRLARQIGALMLAADLLLDAVCVLGPDDPATPGFADEARSLFTAAGALAQLDRLDEALGTPLRRASTSAATKPAGEGAAIGGSGR
jgi:hypothetical protein